MRGPMLLPAKIDRKSPDNHHPRKPDPCTGCGANGLPDFGPLPPSTCPTLFDVLNGQRPLLAPVPPDGGLQPPLSIALGGSGLLQVTFQSQTAGRASGIFQGGLIDLAAFGQPWERFTHQFPASDLIPPKQALRST